MQAVDVLLIFFLAISSQGFALAAPKPLQWFLQSPQRNNPNPNVNPSTDLQRRQIVSDVSTCGYYNGDPKLPRTANPGFDCRVDTQNALWGFCPTTVISASDCGLAGNCQDSHACTSGCGIFNKPSITTFTCTASGNDHCSSLLLTAGPDQTYTYIACGAIAATDHMLAQPTTDSSPATSTSSSPPSTSSPTSTPTLKSSISPSTTPPPATTPVYLATTSVTSSSLASSLPSGVSQSQPSNVGAIVGGVIGGLTILCFSGIAITFLRRRNAAQNNAATNPSNNTFADASENTWNTMSSPIQYANEVPGKPWDNTHEPVELSSRKSSPVELSGSQ